MTICPCHVAGVRCTLGQAIAPRSAFGHSATRAPTKRVPVPDEEKGSSMYIGVGTLVAILIIVLIIYFIRRS
jgi:hypothetical protein